MSRRTYFENLVPSGSFSPLGNCGREISEGPGVSKFRGNPDEKYFFGVLSPAGVNNGLLYAKRRSPMARGEIFFQKFVLPGRFYRLVSAKDTGWGLGADVPGYREKTDFFRKFCPLGTQKTPLLPYRGCDSDEMSSTAYGGKNGGHEMGPNFPEWLDFGFFLKNLVPILQLLPPFS